MSDEPKRCYFPGCEERAVVFVATERQYLAEYQLCREHHRIVEDNGGWEPGYRPSNGTEGDYFRWDTCNVCKHDHEWHVYDDVNGPEPDDSCPIMMSSIAGEHSYPNPAGPPEWQENIRTGETRCTKFERCECGS
jgi:hypothetical protein